MERKESLVQPKIAAKIVELQSEHGLPVNITVKDGTRGMKFLVFEFELIDYNAFAWLVNKGTADATGLPAEEIIDDYD